MNPGSLNKCGELHKRVLTKDTYGEEVTSYVKYANAFFKFEPLRGKEFLQAQQPTAQVSGKILMRYDSRLLSTDRIIYSGRTFEINAIINIGEANRVFEVWYNEIK